MNFIRPLCATLLSLALAAPALAGTEVVINGSTTVLPIMQKAGEAFMAVNPDVSLVISGGGSGNGIKALNDGLCQVAMSSRDMKANEKELAKSRNVDPVRTAIALDALAPVTHPSNSVSALTTEQLREIYQGKIVNWKEVGGPDARIVVISRDTSSGTYETWEDMIMKKQKTTPAALLQASNGAVVQTVSKNKNAIGYIGFGYVNKSVKPLLVDGVEATPSTAIEGKWPIARELYIFTNGRPAGAIKDLTDFLLDPKKGQKLVREVGFIPLSSS